MNNHVTVALNLWSALWVQTLLGISHIVSFLKSVSPNYFSLHAYLFMLLGLLFSQSPKLETLDF